MPSAVDHVIVQKYSTEHNLHHRKHLSEKFASDRTTICGCPHGTTELLGKFMFKFSMSCIVGLG